MNDTHDSAASATATESASTPGTRGRPVHLTHADGELEFDVRPTELDSFGHVNNARYLEYLEWARAEWGNVRGLSYARFRADGLIPAVTEARLRFLHEATLGDRLRIVTRPEIKHAARIIFHQEIFNQHGKRVMRAEVSVVAVDLNHRTFTEFPAVFLDAVKASGDQVVSKGE